MRKVIMSIIMVIMVMASSVAFAESYDSFNHRMGESEWNKPVHWGLGAIAGGLTTYYLPADMHPGWKWATGVLAGTLVGCASEMMDKNWDNDDLIQYVGGGVIGATIVSIPIIKGSF